MEKKHDQTISQIKPIETNDGDIEEVECFGFNEGAKEFLIVYI